jgi:hypothetical protein
MGQGAMKPHAIKLLNSNMKGLKIPQIAYIQKTIVLRNHSFWIRTIFIDAYEI